VRHDERQDRLLLHLVLDNTPSAARLVAAQPGVAIPDALRNSC